VVPFVAFGKSLAILGTRQVEKWNQLEASGRLNGSASLVVLDIEETGGVRWHVEALARL
jgi:hypothetical protein